MKELKLIIITIMIIFTTSCSHKVITLQGTIKTEGVDELTIMDLAAGVIVDTVQVMDGKFKYKADFDSTTIWQIRANNITRGAVAVEAGRIKIDLDERDKIKGTKLNRQLAKHLRKSSKLFTYANELYKSMDSSDDTAMLKFYQNIDTKQSELVNSTISDNLTNIVGTYVFSHSLPKEECTLEAIDRFCEVNPYASNYEPLRLKREEIAYQANTQVGMSYVDFTLRSGDDAEDLNLSDLVANGNYTLLFFTATWCAPCRTIHPFIQEAYDAYAERGLEVATIYIWSSYENAERAIKEYNDPWKSYHIPQGYNGGLRALYGIYSVPTIILLSPDGTILNRTMYGARIKAELSQYLK